ncbi:hypothetical protein HPP92_022978 [Vanilla planifolia]|uniref:Transcriptional corepressor LEUNIG-like n=1 Tax=Vanilla planifolia TaxID=51239 RepID=A0A835UG79_VANPL|nr:hypothetical protein HPP92_022978 [Vanilla planifolia]
MNPRIAGPDGSLIGMPGSNQAGSNLTLKGWPLTGLDHLRSLQQQKSLMQSPQSLNQLQLFGTQQQLILQAQQNLASPPAGEIDARKLRLLLNSRNIVPSWDGQSISVGDVITSASSPMQTGCPVPRAETDMLIKKINQFQQQQSSNQQQQLQQHPISSQQSQSSTPHLHQQDKMGAASVTMDGSITNSFRGNEQGFQCCRLQSQSIRKKQPGSSSGPANSSGTANTAGRSPSSAPSTPLLIAWGCDICATIAAEWKLIKTLLVFGSDGAGNLGSANQLADMDRFVEDGSLDENVESFLSHDDADPRDTVGRSMDISKGFTFTEIGFASASSNKVICCHFSSDGKLLATGGHDKKAVLWCTDTLKPKSYLEEHNLLVTDVRFSPSMPRLATSSFDKTVRVWDADNVAFSQSVRSKVAILQNFVVNWNSVEAIFGIVFTSSRAWRLQAIKLHFFTGHSASVMSLDFHPTKDDLICSCDGDGEIRYWSINNGSCARVFKLLYWVVGGTAQIVPTKGHSKQVDSVCWDPSGEYLASVSEDSVRVWSLGSGSDAECVHELSCRGNKFHSCVFHPTCPRLLVIGCYQSLELWDMQANNTMTLPAHNGLIAALAVSNVTGCVASASHDKIIKLWK